MWGLSHKRRGMRTLGGGRLTIKQEFDDTRALTESVLAEDPNARNNDLWLIISVWRKQGLKVYLDYSKLGEVANFESIRRIRQKIQNEEGRYLPTNPEVCRQRRMRQEAIVRHLISEKKESFL